MMDSRLFKTSRKVKFIKCERTENSTTRRESSKKKKILIREKICGINYILHLEDVMKDERLYNYE